MNIGLFIPCYINLFYPHIGIATLKLLEYYGCNVEYPLKQTCCGQPLASKGFETLAQSTYLHFIECFHSYDWIVAPSGSCVYHVKHHYDILDTKGQTLALSHKIMELSEFLIDILRVDTVPNQNLIKKIGIHYGCHGLRGLQLAQSSEIHVKNRDTMGQLLSLIPGIEIFSGERPDECCGFGGTYSITEPEISSMMGMDRIHDFIQSGAEIICSGDVSCMMHLEGIIRRNKLPIQTRHFVEILISSHEN
ncbi:MAG TPA: (Fe-S)-binding protein [Saprospiraceae bacterium]|nr:(Fe-S)-binding protein [Saprospiraceae bacterium]